ncbi:MAG: YkgJ family cysteine cluster protein [Candidatus Woesearchaeota archaeon]
MQELSLLEHCLKCGAACCNASPLFLEEDKQRLEKLFPYLKFKDMYSYYVIDQEPCYFLENGQCSIQDNKPKDCQSWPISFNVVDGKLVWTLDKNCPASQHLSQEYLTLAKSIASQIPIRVHERYRQDYESNHLNTENLE